MRTIKKLTPKHRATLKKFMARPGHPEGTLSYGEMQGFLFTVAFAPDMVMPSEWLPMIFGDAEPPFHSDREAETVMGALMALFNEVVSSASKEAATRLPSDCAFLEDTLANLESDAPVSQWCRGFQFGHSWLEESWEAGVTEDIEDEFARSLLVLSFFSSRELAEAIVQELARPDRPLETLATDFRELFPWALTNYSRLGQSLYRASLPPRDEARAPTAAPPAPGRNDPCLCGSGRKYKKCCGRHMH
jgi:uncharacterized protein